MCSINGAFAISKEPLPDHVFEQHRQVASTLSHRGPDRTGKLNDDPYCTLSANQLNITGLDNNFQPTSSECSQIVSILNGEIYNYRELNKELENSGCSIRTNCDNETLNKLYLTYGLNAFSKIHGIFGAAIYDRKNRRLILARDRFGQIPLFYYQERGRIHFASESNQLVRFADRVLDQDALLQYFSFGFSFDHLVKGIKRLRPGTYMIVDEKGLHEHVYWKPTFHVDYKISEREATERAYDALQRGVHELTPQEVPHGIFISGGIDSGIVAAIAQTQSPATTLFTSGLTDAELGGATHVDKDYGPVERTGNELSYADSVAADLIAKTGAKYVRKEYHVDELTDQLPRMIKHLPGGPVMSTSFPPFYFTALGAHDHKIRVCLTGEGADELHAGYETCQPENYPSNQIASHFVKLSNFTSANERAKYFGSNSNSRLSEMCNAVDADINTSFEGDGLSEDVAFNKLRFFMLARVFTPHLVEKGNGMAMLGGPTELRMPFLSDSYVDLALKMPARVIRSYTNRKMLLHAVGERAGVPKLIINRPKQRTSLPYYNLFYNDVRFQRYAKSILNKGSLLTDVIGLSNPGDYVFGLQGTPDAHKRAWLLLVLEIWLKEVFVGTNGMPV